MGNGLWAPRKCAVWARAALPTTDRRTSNDAAVEITRKLRIHSTKDATGAPCFQKCLSQTDTLSPRSDADGDFIDNPQRFVTVENRFSSRVRSPGQIWAVTIFLRPAARHFCSAWKRSNAPEVGPESCHRSCFPGHLPFGKSEHQGADDASRMSVPGRYTGRRVLLRSSTLRIRILS